MLVSSRKATTTTMVSSTLVVLLALTSVLFSIASSYELDRDHHFHYDSVMASKGKVFGVGRAEGSSVPFRVTAEVIIRPYNVTADGSLDCMMSFGSIWIRREKEQGVFVLIPPEDDWFKWFSFRQSPSGDILEVHYPLDEPENVVNIKKGILSSLSGRIHDDLARARRGDLDQWQWKTRELGHAGEQNAEYVARRIGAYFHVTKVSHDSHPEHGSHLHRKVMIVDAETMIPQRITVEEHIHAHQNKTVEDMLFGDEAEEDEADEANAAHVARRGLPVEEHSPVKGLPIDQPSPSWKFSGRASTNITFMRSVRAVATVVIGERELLPGEINEFMTLEAQEEAGVIYKPPEHRLARDSIKSSKAIAPPSSYWVAQVIRTLDCFHVHPHPGSATRARCFQDLYHILQSLSESNITAITEEVFLVINDPVHRVVFIEALSTLGTELAQNLLIQHVLLADDAVIDEVHKVIMAFHTIKTPSDEAIRVMKAMCFHAGTEHFAFDLTFFSPTRKVALLALGSIINNMHAYDPQQAEELLALLHDELEAHEVDIARRGISSNDDDGSISVHDRHKGTIIHALGNAGHFTSTDIIVSYVTSDDESDHVRAAAVHSLRFFQSDEIDTAIVNSLNDSSPAVRSSAYHSYSAQRRSVAFPSNLSVHDGEHRDRRVSLKDILDWSWELRLTAPGFNFSFGFGSNQLGAFVKAVSANTILIHLSILKSYLDFNIYNEGAAYLALFGKTVYIFRLLLAYIAWWGYDFEVIRKFNIDDIFNIQKTFQRIVNFIMEKVNQAKAFVQEAIARFKDIADSVMNAILSIPTALIAIFNKIRDLLTGQIDNVAKTPAGDQKDESFLVQLMITLTQEFIEDLIGMNLTFVIKSVTSDLALLGINSNRGVVMIIDAIRLFFECPLGAILGVIGGANDIRLALFSTNETLGWGLIPIAAKIIDETGILDGGIPPWLTTIPDQAYVLLDEITNYITACLGFVIKNGTITVLPNNTKYTCAFGDTAKEIQNVIQKIEYNKQWLLNVTAYYMQVYENVSNTFRTMKSYFEKIRSIIDGIFGPKFDKGFPYDPFKDTDPPACSDGTYVDEARNQSKPTTGPVTNSDISGGFGSEGKNTYDNSELPGIDISLGGVPNIVAPFQGTIKATGSNWVVISAFGALSQYDIKVQYFTPNGSLNGKEVKAGVVIGTATGKQCPGGNTDYVVRVSMKRKVAAIGQPTYIDPSKYLKRRIDIGLMMKETINQFLYIQMMKTYVDMYVLPTKGSFKKNTTTGSSTKKRDVYSLRTNPGADDIRSRSSASAVTRRGTNTCADFEGTADVCFVFEKKNVVYYSIPIYAYTFSQTFGPVKVDFMFGAYLDLGIDLWLQLCLMNKTCHAIVTPHAGVAITAMAAIDIGIAAAGITIKGILMEIGLPIHGIIKFKSFPLQVCVQLDMYIIPIQFFIAAFLKLKIFGVKVTIFDANIFEWASTPIRMDALISFCTPKKDKTPPQFTKPFQCKQLTEQDPSQPILYCEWAVEDPDSGVAKLEFCGGSSPGACDLFPYEEVTGDNIRSGRATVREGHLYVTLRASNQDGVFGTSTSALIPWDMSPPAIRVFDGNETNYYLTSLFTSRAMQRFQDEASAQYDVVDDLRPLILMQWAIGTTPVAKVPPVPGMSDVVSWRNFTWHDFRQGSESYGYLYADPTMFNFKMKHNTIYYFHIRAINELAYENAVASRGFLVDLTPPNIAPVNNGGKINYHKRATQLNTVASVNWDTFVDNESGNYATRLSLSKLCDCSHPDNSTCPFYDIIPGFGASDDAVQMDSQARAYFKSMTPPLADGFYYWRVQVQNWVGLWSNYSCRMYIVDTTPPLWKNCFSVEQCMVLTYDVAKNALVARWEAYDPESDIQFYEFALGLDETDTSLMQWTLVDLNTTWTIFNPPSGVKIVGKARAYNWVDLPARTFSNTVIIDATPPIAGNVGDGATPFYDVAYQKLTTEVNFNWDSFRDPESGIAGYSYLLGSFPGSDDVTKLNDMIETSVANKKCFIFANTTYYVTIVATHGGALALTVNATSNGVLVDTSLPGEEQEASGFVISVADGAPTDSVEREYQHAASALNAYWPVIIDPQSLIYTLEVAYVIGTPAGPNGAIPTDKDELDQLIQGLEFLPVLNDTTYSALDHLALDHGSKYFFFIRATDGALWQKVWISNGVVVDLTLPVFTYMYDANPNFDLDYQATTEYLSLYWLVQDPESDILRQSITLWRSTPVVTRLTDIQTVTHPLQSALGLPPYLLLTCDEVTPKQKKCQMTASSTSGTYEITTGSAFFWQVEAENRANLITTLATDGVKIDVTPPTMIYVLDGLSKPDVSMQYDNSTLFGHWSGADPESGIIWYNVAVVDLGILVDENYQTNGLPFTQVTRWRDLCDGASEDVAKANALKWQVGTNCTNAGHVSFTLHRAFEKVDLSYGIMKFNKTAEQLQLRHTYILVVYATNGALVDSIPMSSDGGVIIVAAPSPGTVYDGPAGGELQFQRVDSVLTAWFSGFSSPAFGFTGFEVAIGTSTEASHEFNVLEFNDDPILITSKFDSNAGGILQIPISMPEGVRFFVTIKGTTQQLLDDGTWLSVMSISNGIVSDSLAPVFHGFTEGTTSYQLSAATFTAAFNITDDTTCRQYNGTSKTCAVSGLRPLEYMVGTMPELDDILPRRLTPLNGTATSLTVRPHEPFPDEAALYNSTLRSVYPPVNGVPYIFTMVATDFLNQRTALASYGVVVDNTEPFIGIVDCGAPIQSDTTRFSCSWISFLDHESGIDFFSFSVGIAPSDNSIVANITTEDTTYLALGLSLSHGITYYGTVRATNLVGMSTVASSTGVFIDTTPPIAGRVIEVSDFRDVKQFNVDMDIANMESFDADCQLSTTRIIARFTGFYDPDGTPITRYTASVGTTRGGVQVLSFTPVVPITIGNITEVVITVPTPLALRQIYYVTIRAFNFVNLFASASSNGIKISFNPPQPIFTKLYDYVPGWINTEGAIIDAIKTSSTDTLGVYFEVDDGCDPKKIVYSILVETLNGDRTLMPWKELASRPGAVFYSQYEGLNLTNTYSYRIGVKAVNQLGFTTIQYTNGIQVINGGPPSPGVVTDGPTGVDVDFQASLTTISACWSGFIDFDNSTITKYEVAVGTDPRFDGKIDNIAKFTATADTCHKFSGLSNLVPLTVTYYVSVRATGVFTLTTTASSNGIKVGFGQAEVVLNVEGNPSDVNPYLYTLRDNIAGLIKGQFSSLEDFISNNVIIVSVTNKQLFDLSVGLANDAGVQATEAQKIASDGRDFSSADSAPVEEDAARRRRHQMFPGNRGFVEANRRSIAMTQAQEAANNAYAAAYGDGHNIHRRADNETFTLSEDPAPITEPLTNTTIILVVFDYQRTFEKLHLSDEEFTDLVSHNFSTMSLAVCSSGNATVDCLTKNLGVVSVEGVDLDLNAPSFGKVYDGSDSKIDLDYQASNTTLTVSWDGFYHDEGVIQYDIAIGLDSAPVIQPTNSSRYVLKNNGTFEVLNFTTVTQCNKTVTVDTICIPASSYTFHNLSLVNNVTYYVSVRAVSRIDTETIVTSDGILIDQTNPTPGNETFVTTSPPLIPPTGEDSIVPVPVISPKIRFQGDATQINLHLSNFSDPESGIAGYFYTIISVPKDQCMNYPAPISAEALASPFPFSYTKASSDYTFPMYLPAPDMVDGTEVLNQVFPLMNNASTLVVMSSLLAANGTTFDGLYNRTHWTPELAITGLDLSSDNVYYVSLATVNGAGIPRWSYTRALVADKTRPISGSLFDGDSPSSDIAYSSNRYSLTITFAEAPSIHALACPSLTYDMSGPHPDWYFRETFWYDIVDKQQDSVIASDTLPSYEDAVADGYNVVSAQTRVDSALFSSGDLYLKIRNINNVTNPIWTGAQYVKNGRTSGNGMYKVRLQAAYGEGAVTRITFAVGDVNQLPFHTNKDCAGSCKAPDNVKAFGVIFYGSPIIITLDSGAQAEASGAMWMTTKAGMLSFSNFKFQYSNATGPANQSETFYSPYDSHEYSFRFRETELQISVDGTLVYQPSLPFKLVNASLVIDTFGAPQDTLQTSRAIIESVQTPTPEIDVCDSMDVFYDLESPILYYEWAIGSERLGTDMMNFTRVNDSAICMPCRGGPCDETFCDPSCDPNSVRVVTSVSTPVVLAEFVRYCNIANGGCHPAATCTPSTNLFEYFVHCECPVGFSGNGTYCEFENKCHLDVKGVSRHASCSSHSICKDIDNSFVCTCESGFQGNGTVCEDINECSPIYQAIAKYKCHPQGECHNTEGSYNCSCAPGFAGDGKYYCENVNECYFDNGNCSSNAYCYDTFGSWICECKDNYFGDGFSCTEGGNYCGNPLIMTTPTRGNYYAQRGDATAYPPFDINSMVQCGPGRTGSKGVWHAFNGTGFPMQLSTCVAGYDPYSFDSVIEVYAGGCSHLQCIAFGDDDANAGSTASRLMFASGTSDLLSKTLVDSSTTLSSCGYLSTTPPFETVANVTYHVLVRSFLANAGRYTLHLRNLGRFNNDCGCQNNATCDPESGGCICSINYTGEKCEKVAVRSWCKEGNEDFCSDYATCVDDNTDGTVGEITGSCVCDTGFVGDGFYCENENECVTRNFIVDQECDSIARCEDTFGGYRCSCPAGYMGSGRGTGTCVVDPDAQAQYPADDLDKQFPITYFVTLRAVSAAGLVTTVSSNGITIDTSPAEVSYINFIAVNPAPGYEVAPIFAQTESNIVSFRWLFRDVQSGLVSFVVSVGSLADDTSLVPYHTYASTVESVTYTNLTMTLNTRYFAWISALNGAGLTIKVRNDGLLVDTTAPLGGTVYDIYPNTINCHIVNNVAFADVAWVTNRQAFAVAYSGFSDPESGLKSFDWAIGVTPGGEEIMPYSEAGNANSSFALVTASMPSIETGCGTPDAHGNVNAICLTGRDTYWNIGHTIYFRNFQLAAPRTYYNTIRAWNNVGLSVVVSSDGVNVVDSDACTAIGPCASTISAQDGTVCVVPVTTPTVGPTPTATSVAATPTATATASASATVAPPPPAGFVTMSVNAVNAFPANNYILVVSPLTDADLNAFGADSNDTRRVRSPATVPPYQTYLGFSAMARAFDSATHLDTDINPVNEYRVTLTWNPLYVNINTSYERIDVVAFDRVHLRWIDASKTCATPSYTVDMNAHTITVNVCITSQLAFVKTALGALSPDMSCARSGCAGVIYRNVPDAPDVYCNCDADCLLYGDCCLDYYQYCM